MRGGLDETAGALFTSDSMSAQQQAAYVEEKKDDVEEPRGMPVPAMPRLTPEQYQAMEALAEKEALEDERVRKLAIEELKRQQKQFVPRKFVRNQGESAEEFVCLLCATRDSRCRPLM